MLSGPREVSLPPSADVGHHLGHRIPVPAVRVSSEVNVLKFNVKIQLTHQDVLPILIHEKQ
jgi:hypothetical protein